MSRGQIKIQAQELYLKHGKRFTNGTPGESFCEDCGKALGKMSYKAFDHIACSKHCLINCLCEDVTDDIFEDALTPSLRTLSRVYLSGYTIRVTYDHHPEGGYRTLVTVGGYTKVDERYTSEGLAFKRAFDAVVFITGGYSWPAVGGL